MVRTVPQQSQNYGAIRIRRYGECGSIERGDGGNCFSISIASSFRLLTGPSAAENVEKKRVFRPLTKLKFETFRQETNEDETNVMKKGRVDIFKKKTQKRTLEKKVKRNVKKKMQRKSRMACRSLAWEGECIRGKDCPFSHMQSAIEQLKNEHCRFYLHGKCKFGSQCRLLHHESEKELVRMEKLTKTLFSQSKELEAVAEEEMKEEYDEVKEEEEGEGGRTTTQVKGLDECGPEMKMRSFTMFHGEKAMEAAKVEEKICSRLLQSGVSLMM